MWEVRGAAPTHSLEREIPPQQHSQVWEWHQAHHSAPSEGQTAAFLQNHNDNYKEPQQDEQEGFWFQICH